MTGLAQEIRMPSRTTA